MTQLISNFWLDKILALKRVGKIQYEGFMSLSERAKDELQWWHSSLPKASRDIRTTTPEFTLTTAASLTGCGGGGREVQEVFGLKWRPSFTSMNVLEPKAVLIGLETFFKEKRGVSVKVLSDNTTTVAYVNHTGEHKIRALQ